MTDDIFTSDGLSSGLPENTEHISLQSTIAAYPDLINEIKQFDPVKSASVFSGLLTEPEFQSNCYCLETLVHIIIVKGNGTRKVSHQNIANWFSIFKNGTCGVMDDPAEDVFISQVSTPKGNFRIIEGLWESSGFYLQRVLNIVEGMPDAKGYNEIRENIYSLLTISDVIIERSGLTKYQLGNPEPVEHIQKKYLKKYKSYRERISFTPLDLQEHGIDINALECFSFEYEHRDLLSTETLGHTYLERYPVLINRNKLYILLPTSISSAIRRYVYECMKFSGQKNAFLRGVANEYSLLFSNNPILGKTTNYPVEFKEGENGLFSTVMFNVDGGKFLNLIFYVDNLKGFSETGFLGTNPQNKNVGFEIDKPIRAYYNKAKNEDNFQSGITIIIGCGIGRGINIGIEKISDVNWKMLVFGAADFFTLGWVENFKVLSLWGINDAADKLSSLGVTLFNINGFLNLVAWAESLKGHLVPHGEVPDAMGTSESLVLVEQNAMRLLRYKVLNEIDPCRVINIDDKYVDVKRIHYNSLFVEDRFIPLYGVGDESFLDGMPAVYVTDNRPWWVEAYFDEDFSFEYRFNSWEMLTVWLSRTVPVLDKYFQTMNERPVLWRVKFEKEVFSQYEDVKQESIESILNMISFKVDAKKQIIDMTVNENFLQSTFQTENTSERALVMRFVESVFFLNKEKVSKDKLNKIVGGIVRSNNARQMHAFALKNFRDFVRDNIPSYPLKIDVYDEGLTKLGLGWCVYERNRGSVIVGKEKCTAYLNSLVDYLLDEIFKELSQFNRMKIIEFALENHESAQFNKKWWMRTSGAAIALRKNKDIARKTIINHEMELNAISHATRLLIDIALCESDETGGRGVGKLEVSRVMSNILLASNFGGCSDAIHWDAMEPKIVITPLGDVHMNFEFFDKVLNPFGRVNIDQNISQSIAEYTENLKKPEFYPDVEDKIEPDFSMAWKEEMGATANDYRLFVDFIEDKGINENLAILKGTLDYFMPGENVGLSRETVTKIINNLALSTRSSYRTVPAGYDKKDCQVWKFKRRLSVLRKPFIMVRHENTDLLIIAPGLLRESFINTVDGYYHGNFPVWQLKSKKMRSWAGKSMHIRGNDFSKEVGERLTGYGWKVETEVPVTKILKKGFDKDYGDIDVLAWNKKNGRILLIECKDVQFRKTPGEIAEQLSDFRGEIKSNGKPDFLRKHLDRIDIIIENKNNVYEYLGVDENYTIEGHLIFKNPVPMQYAWENMKKTCPISIHSNLDIFSIK